MIFPSASVCCRGAGAGLTAALFSFILSVSLGEGVALASFQLISAVSVFDEPRVASRYRAAQVRRKVHAASGGVGLRHNHSGFSDT